MNSNLHAPREVVQPILVLLVWRGGERFERSLESLRDSEMYFKRIIISITSEPDSQDMKTALKFIDEMAHSGKSSRIEIICTNRELPTMQHQAFWIDYLDRTGARSDDWIFWLAYDDQICGAGIRELLGAQVSWPLKPRTSYIGPWLMRHESADELWIPAEAHEEEIWTSLPIKSPLSISVFGWVRDQLLHPTYMQMSGSVTQLYQHRRLVHNRFPKRGPMRIEMATVAAPGVKHVEEFTHPVSIIYGRSTSDRANYSGQSRAEDFHLIWTAKGLFVRHPFGALSLFVKILIQRLRGFGKDREEWRVRRISTY